MPTPMPIIVAICTPKSGTSTTLAISHTPPRATPRPNPAMTSGRPAASAEPNATSRITSAASSPTDSEPASCCSTCLDRVAAELDPQAVALGLAGQVHHPLDRGHRELLARLVEPHLQHARRPVGGDEAGLGGHDVGDVAQLGREGVDAARSSAASVTPPSAV